MWAKTSGIHHDSFLVLQRNRSSSVRLCWVVLIALIVNVNGITSKDGDKIKIILEDVEEQTKTEAPEIPESTHNQTSQSCYETCTPYPEFDCINETCIQCYVDGIYQCLDDIEIVPFVEDEHIMELVIFFGLLVFAAFMIHAMRGIFACKHKCCNRSKAVNRLDEETPPTAVASTRRQSASPEIVTFDIPPFVISRNDSSPSPSLPPAYVQTQCAAPVRVEIPMVHDTPPSYFQAVAWEKQANARR